jgi:adsorption protein A
MTHRPQQQRTLSLLIAGLLAVFATSAAAQPQAAHAAADAGYKAFARKDYAAAIEQARRAVELAPARRDYWLLLAQAHLGAEQWAEAQQALDRAGQASGDDATLARAKADLARARAQAEGTAMYRALQANDLKAAIAHGSAAIQHAPEHPAYRLVLVHALLRDNQYAQAEKIAGETIALLPDSAAPLALRGYARHALNRPADATADVDRALQQRGVPAAAQRQLRLLAADLALAQGNGPRALELLQPLPAGDADAAARRDHARQGAALRSGAGAYPLRAPSIDCTSVEAAQTCLLMASAAPQLPGFANASAAYRALEQKDAARALEQARLATAASPAHRDWQLLHMNAALAAGETEEARRVADALRAAGDLPPRAHLDLAYLSTRVGDDRAAHAAFQQADAAGALPAGSLLDAGYAAVRARRDDEAIAYFKRAIDADGLQLKMEPQLLYDTRRTVAEVSRKWGVLASITMRNGGNVVPTFGAVGGGPGGQRTTQAGAEAYWRPWGYRNGQFVELFARGFATLHNEAGGLEGGDSFSGGLGVRWKPLTAHNLVLSLSRTFGPNVNDDWLAQVGYSLDHGTDLRVDTASWWTTRFSAEVGRYLENEQNYGVASLMFGRSFAVGDGRTVVYPHGVLAAEYSSVDSPRTSVGAGPGVSVRRWFREDKYHAPRSYADITLQYRARLSGDDRMKGFYLNGLVSY